MPDSCERVGYLLTRYRVDDPSGRGDPPTVCPFHFYPIQPWLVVLKEREKESCVSLKIPSICFLFCVSVNGDGRLPIESRNDRANLAGKIKQTFRWGEKTSGENQAERDVVPIKVMTVTPRWSPLP